MTLTYANSTLAKWNSEENTSHVNYTFWNTVHCSFAISSFLEANRNLDQISIKTQHNKYTSFFSNVFVSFSVCGRDNVQLAQWTNLMSRQTPCIFCLIKQWNFVRYDEKLFFFKQNYVLLVFSEHQQSYVTLYNLDHFFLKLALQLPILYTT